MLCAQSSTATAPQACAASMMRLTGGTVPSTFDMPVNATTRVRGPIARSISSSETTPVNATTRVRGPIARSISSSETTPARSGTMKESLAPESRAAVCHGTRLL